MLSKLKQVHNVFDAKKKATSPLLATIRTLDQNTQNAKPQKLQTKKSAHFGFDQAIINVEMKTVSKQRNGMAAREKQS